MELKNVTWPTSKKVLKHVIISLIGILFLIIFFIIIDQLVSLGLEQIYL